MLKSLGHMERHRTWPLLLTCEHGFYSAFMSKTPLSGAIASRLSEQSGDPSALMGHPKRKAARQQRERTPGFCGNKARRSGLCLRAVSRARGSHFGQVKCLETTPDPPCRDPARAPLSLWETG